MNSFVRFFWENSRTPKCPFEIIWPLVVSGGSKGFWVRGFRRPYDRSLGLARNHQQNDSLSSVEKKSRWWSVEFSVLLWFFFGLHTRTAHKENWFSMSSLTLVMCGAKSYIPSIINTDYILWQLELIVAVSVFSLFGPKTYTPKPKLSIFSLLKVNQFFLSDAAM